MGLQPQDVLKARLQELAGRCAAVETPIFSRFMSPAEAESANRIAREQNVEATLFGGYPQAERVIACFHLPDDPPSGFPIRCLQIGWDERSGSPDHRALLGSVLGLGIDRSQIGDICLGDREAFLFSTAEMAAVVQDQLTIAGRIPIHAKLLLQTPPMPRGELSFLRESVASLRLDAVLAAGMRLSRTQACDIIRQGLVQLNHRPALKSDAQISQGDLLSVRGFGRLRLLEVGSPTRKGRLPILMEYPGKIK